MGNLPGGAGLEAAGEEQWGPSRAQPFPPGAAEFPVQHPWDETPVKG